MSSYGRNFSTRLFIQAAFTGLLAPAGSRSSTWLMATFAIAVGAAVVGAVVRTGHDRTRELVIGFEAVAVAVGAVGLVGGHYIPGTIVGIGALVPAVNHSMPHAVAVPAQTAPVEAAPVAAPEYAPMPVPQFAAPAPMTDFAAPAPVSQFVPEPAAETVSEPVAEQVPPMATPVTAPVTGVRAMDILPGK